MFVVYKTFVHETKFKNNSIFKFHYWWPIATSKIFFSKKTTFITCKTVVTYIVTNKRIWYCSNKNNSILQVSRLNGLEQKYKIICHQTN